MTRLFAKLLILFFAEQAVDPGTALIIVAVFVVVAIVLIILMALGVKRDRRKIQQATLNRDKLTPVVFDRLILSAFQKAAKRTKFALYYMQMADAASIITAFGQEVYDDAMDKLMIRLEKTFPWSVKICRYAEDAIAVFTTEPMQYKELREHAEYMAFEGKKVHTLAANLRFNIAFNIGVNEKNEFSPGPEEFWQNARIALNSAKKAGANTFAIYSAELTNRETEEYKFYQEIKQAIEDKEFELFYQPIVEIKSKAPIGYESLLRWNHKTLGVLAPTRYLKIMEQSGDINWVGIWAFEELVKQSLTWRHKNPARNLILTMNLSQKQLMNDKLAEEFRRIAKKHRVAHNDFCFEIADFDILGKTDNVKNNIMKLKQAGFMLAINSYGLEVNSIAILEKIDIDVVKLDKNFLLRAQENFLLSSVLTMLKRYTEKKNALIVAEGIETEEEAALAVKFELEYAQGYFFGRPESVTEIDRQE